MDLAQWLSQRQIRFRVTGDNVYICCPFCAEQGTTADTRYRLGIRVGTGQAQCFNCGWKSGGQATWNSLARVFGGGQICAEPTVTGSAQQVLQQKPIVWQLPREYVAFEGDESEEGDTAWQYLRSRGVTWEQFRDWELGYALAGRYAYRALFPFRDATGELWGFVGRDYTGRSPIKYLYPQGMQKGIYGLEKADGRNLVLVEGVLDALAVWRAGYAAGAILGSKLTDQQLSVLKQRPPRQITLMIDWDEAGVGGVWQTLGKLETLVGCCIKIALPIEGKNDAGEMTDSMIQTSLEAAEQASPELIRWLQLQEWKTRVGHGERRAFATGCSG